MFDDTFKLKIRADDIIPKADFRVIRPSIWKRALSWIWTDWKQPRTVKTVPYLQLGDTIYLHPANAKALKEYIDKYSKLPTQQGDGVNHEF